MKLLSKLIKPLLLIVVVLGLLWFNHKVLHLSPEGIRTWYSYSSGCTRIIHLHLCVAPSDFVSCFRAFLDGRFGFRSFVGNRVYDCRCDVRGGVVFWLARLLGNKLVSKKSNEKWDKLGKQLQQKGFIYILLLRLIPIFPFDFISYGAGVSKVNFTAFLSGTLLGIIPGTFAYSFLGSSFLDEKKSYIFIAVIVFVLVTLIPLVFKKRVFKT